jgi:membrane protease subunit HflK
MIRRGGQSVRRVLPGGFWSFRGGALIVLAVFVIWMMTGFYRVDQREAGVELVFGRMVNATGPGLNWNWPAPIGQTLTPSVKDPRQIDIGFRANPNTGQIQQATDESLMLTGDENIIDIQVTVLWKVDEKIYEVKEPNGKTRKVQNGIRKFLFNIRNPEKTVKDAAESALRENVGLREFEVIRTRDRASIESEVRDRVQQLLNDYGAGIEVIRITLRNTDPPEEVRDAFRDVQAARADNDRLIQEATKHKNKVENEARGEADRLTARGDAYRQEQINKASGETERFLAIYKQYASAKDITRQRIYLSTMQEILGGMDKILVSQGSGGVVPYLPLRELRKGTSDANRSSGNGDGRQRATVGPKR